MNSASSGAGLAPGAVLSVQGVSKFYPGIVALDGVDLALYRGQAHGLAGENGAGKSTLIKILAGAIRTDGGTLGVAGQRVRIASPLAARRLGIAVVHQHSHLIPDLTLAENYALREGYPRRFAGGIHWGQLRSAAERAVHVMLPGMDVGRPARLLSGVEKQMVEISFALAARPRVLILDEPTAILPHAESDRLFRMVRSYLAGDGAVLFVSHRLDEIFSLCHQVTILRDGQRVWTKPTIETDNDDLIRAMVGRGVSFERDESLEPGAEARLNVAGLTDGAGAFADVSLSVKAGEIYGVYGLVGAGQSELCAALLGLRRCSAGTIRLVGEDGEDVDLHRVTGGGRVRRGLALVPAERLERGMFRQMTVGENMSISSLGRKSVLGLVRGGAENRENLESIRSLRVKTPGPHKKAIQLSGGNQQKVLLARWLQTHPRVLVLEEPTQGVDVGAKVEIHRLIREQARRGVAIILVSSEMPELLALSHRVGIMNRGKLVAELDGAGATEEEILRVALPPQEHDPDVAAGDDIAADVAAPVRRPTRTGRLLAVRELGIAALLVVLVAAASVYVPNFATWENFRDILRSQSILLLGALGVGMVIIAGGIDISIGAILGLAALAAGKADQAGMSPLVIGTLPLLVGAALGAINGLLTVFGRVHSIVITLGMMFILQGVMLEIMDGRWLFNLSEQLTSIGRGSVGPVPNLIVFAVAGAMVTWVILSKTVTGRRFYALGGDEPSARLLGINPKFVLPVAFALSGLLVGLGGMLHAGYYGQVQTNAGSGFELKAIAAAVIGGVHIMGGRGTALGIVLGAVLLGVISNLLVLLHISALWDNVVTGAIILLAVCADAFTSWRERAAR